jgi:ribonuclease HI
MELLACIAALSTIKNPAAVVLHSDSKYVINGITKGWAEKWRANGWMRTKTEPAQNPDLWDRLLQLCAKHDVQFKWVKGHAGIAGNERCDELATQAAKGTKLAVDREYEKSIQ